MTNKNSKGKYLNLKNHPGIFKHSVTGKYLARKKIGNKSFKKTFKTINQAKYWRNTFDGSDQETGTGKTSTLKEVWEEMQECHFPGLAPSTIDIWHRRYVLLKEIEKLPMHKITPQVITGWIEKQVKYYKSEFYKECQRGNAKRCNLNNELNLFTTIFNWYKNDSERFQYESRGLENPIRTSHKKKGFIRAKPVKRMAITLEHALKFFEYLRPLYRDLAMLQFFTASRIGEAAGLQWNRIELENRTLTIMETCNWDMTSKMFVGLNPHPKNKEPRPVYITDEILEILKRRKQFQIPGNNFVFHVEGSPLNYGTIQLNYREAQRKGKLPYSGTHILRHGMATLARKIGGGLDAVIAMTGHKDIKLADHYSKLDDELQKETSLKIMDEINKLKQESNSSHDTESNIIYLSKFAKN